MMYISLIAASYEIIMQGFWKCLKSDSRPDLTTNWSEVLLLQRMKSGTFYVYDTEKSSSG